MIYSDGQNVIKGAWASRPHSKLDRRQEDLSVLSRREFDSQPLQTQSLRKGLSWMATVELVADDGEVL